MILSIVILIMGLSMAGCDNAGNNNASNQDVGVMTPNDVNSDSENIDTSSTRNENLVWNEEIKEQDFDGLTVCVVAYGDNLQMLLNNNSGETRTYGGKYVLQYKENGSYIDVSANSPVPYDENMYEIEHEQIFVTEFDVSCFNCSNPGDYRFKYGDLYCDFTLIEK